LTTFLSSSGLPLVLLLLLLPPVLLPLESVLQVGPAQMCLPLTPKLPPPPPTPPRRKPRQKCIIYGCSGSSVGVAISTTRTALRR
jgi:hypothetical protein